MCCPELLSSCGFEREHQKARAAPKTLSPPRCCFLGGRPSRASGSTILWVARLISAHRLRASPLLPNSRFALGLTCFLSGGLVQQSWHGAVLTFAGPGTAGPTPSLIPSATRVTSAELLTFLCLSLLICKVGAIPAQRVVVRIKSGDVHKRYLTRSRLRTLRPLTTRLFHGPLGPGLASYRVRVKSSQRLLL